MTDCYRILGVDRDATSETIRAAYLARMKVCHPDAGGKVAASEAAQLSQAYWQLRDADRRREHDRMLNPPPPTNLTPREQPRPIRAGKPIRKGKARSKVSLAKPAAKGKGAAMTARVGARSSPRRAGGKRLEPLRAAAGVAACSIAIAGFALAGSHFGSTGASQAHAAAAVSAVARPLPAPPRRQIDAHLARSATGEFRSILARSGAEGAHRYARQCLVELTARPTMTMLDYCLAFDDAASAWEARPERGRAGSPRYFAATQRFGRYASAAREIEAGPVRDSMLATVSYFAQDRD